MGEKIFLAFSKAHIPFFMGNFGQKLKRKAK